MRVVHNSIQCTPLLVGQCHGIHWAEPKKELGSARGLLLRWKQAFCGGSRGVLHPGQGKGQRVSWEVVPGRGFVPHSRSSLLRCILPPVPGCSAPLRERCQTFVHFALVGALRNPTTLLEFLPYQP